MISLLLAVLAVVPDPPSQTVLEGQATRFAEAWVGGDRRALAQLMAPEGIRLHLPGEEHSVVAPRQAQAALGVFLDRYVSGDAQVTRASLTTGGEDEGFAEIQWSTGSPGVSGPVIFTIFVAYTLRDDDWVVTEIRVLFP